MRLTLFATAVFTCLANVGSAADLPLRPTLPPIAYAPAFTWAGFYAGVNAGVGGFT